MIRIIRFALSIGLTIGVYSEAGGWTAAFCFLMFLAWEDNARRNSKAAQEIEAKTVMITVHSEAEMEALLNQLPPSIILQKMRQQTWKP